MTIAKPRNPRTHPDRFNECQIAVEDQLLALLGDATTAGWETDEILAAIIEVAENTNLAMHETKLLSTETELKRFRKRKDV